MTATLNAPPAAEVSDLMRGLFGLAITDKAAADFQPYSIAEYVDESGDVAGYLSCDLASGCRMAAALTQIPAGRVDEAISDGAIDENLAENLNEVFNISVALLAPADGSRVVLKRVLHGSGSEGFSEAAAALNDRDCTDYAFEVARYGDCYLQVGC
ncbi:MAG: hypothetical protein Fues2KO_41130 [Fuerstiella sp.]